MLTRRIALAAPLAALPVFARAQGGFAAFLASVRAEARAQGVRDAVLDAALAGLQPNPKVIALSQRQPEVTLSWAQYKARVLTATRLQQGQQVYRDNAALLRGLIARYPADSRIVTAIWGLESGFGAHTGSYSVVGSLATLAWSGHRPAFFRAELIHALQILDAGDVPPSGLLGSWAGAMGQPQFMPSSYLRYAVDADGDGRRDIWSDRADILGSIANYLAQCGWQPALPWGQPVSLPPGFSAPTGRDVRLSLGRWEAMGVRRFDGSAFSRKDVAGAVLLPDGPGGEAFMVYENFHVIRRYNASDYYALAVGLLAYAVV